MEQLLRQIAQMYMAQIDKLIACDALRQLELHARQWSIPVLRPTKNMQWLVQHTPIFEFLPRSVLAATCLNALPDRRADHGFVPKNKADQRVQPDGYPLLGHQSHQLRQ